MATYIFKHVPSYELDKLQNFINVHWKTGHALAISKPLIDFQHYNAFDDTYNFIVAEHCETKDYDAIVGYIPTAQYDSALSSNGDYWGAIWKVREDVQNSDINAAAFYLWKSLFKLPNFQSYAAIGISEIAKQIYIASRMTIDTLRHYYLLNDKIKDFSIADHVHACHKNVSSALSTDILTLKWLSEEELSKQSVLPVYRPYKSVTYLLNRYAKHPFYKYSFLGVYRNNDIVAVWVIRKIEINKSIILRVVDMLGTLEGNVRDSLLNILYETNAEYIDFLNYGIEESVFYQMGFNKLQFDGDLIIPNYMEPFERRNVQINLAYKAKFEHYVAFKGDSDQDRPNIL